MYRVCIGQKVKNVGGRNYYGGDILPKDYEPPKDYIEQNIVEKVKGGKKWQQEQDD
jgi:hypothetical protein